MTGQIEDYEVLDVIGTGSFGTCYKVRNKQTGRIYVWKAIDYGKMTEEKKQLLVSEVNLLSELSHPNIVKYYDRILHKETTTLYIIMEWCQGGDLASLIEHYKSKCTSVEEVFVWRVLYQTGRALQACHSHLRDVTVLHRDIKPANVFLDSYGNVKLGDFGLARILHGQRAYSDTIVGTPYYMSPEVIKGKKYDRKSDIWALGCLVYELCAFNPPFLGSDLEQLASNIRNGRFEPIPSNYSEDLQKIIELMLSVDHKYRPTIEMILHHPTVVVKVTTKKEGSRELVPQRKKSQSALDREPEEVSEAAFQQKWMTKLESLKQREANIRTREDKLIDKERALAKREKHLLLIERISKEKLARAEVYLRQCKENRLSSHQSGIVKHHKYRMVEELDTSFSADPGDTSILPTSAKIQPEEIPLPITFARATSERKSKHVHFNVNKHGPMENFPEGLREALNEIQNCETLVKAPKAVLKKVSSETKDVGQTRFFGTVNMRTVSVTDKKLIAERPVSLGNFPYIKEKKKLAAHQSSNKENDENFHQLDLKETKKKLSKISLFSKKQTML